MIKEKAGMGDITPASKKSCYHRHIKYAIY
ncbi:UNVERIFIED_ORG: hypothetical protein J2S99_001392 [Atlantibacter hermannii]|nr:hypothetical protein [Atlantibacter hermannii]